MHDLQLVGVHDDGEHLVLSDGDGRRYLLGVDEALRAAVRRDRAHLGQLQIEIGGELRPREVQARIRAGATAEEVAAASGWPLERVRRYEGPVLAEREHVARLARDVVLRRRSGESPTLGTEVTRRLTARGVDAEKVTWDSWRPDQGPWTVAVSFSAGGRDRQARWHLDLSGRSVTPADDEARWLSEQSPEGEGPLGGVRLAAVPTSSVYDVEADGGVADASHDPLDLMTAMRSRRRERDLHRPTRRSHDAGADPADVPGALHPARRRRQTRPEPLELDPTLLGDPPAAHPPASELPPELLDEAPRLSAATTTAHEAASDVGDVPGLADEGSEPGSDDVTSLRPADRQPPRRWPLAAHMHEPSADDVALIVDPASSPHGDDDRGPAVLVSSDRDADPMAEVGQDGEVGEVGEDGDVGDRSSPRHRAPARAKARRPSVPSWDDIMFGAKRD
jgi:hypothetical protein